MQGYDLRVTLAISGVLLAIAAWLWWWVEGLAAVVLTPAHGDFNDDLAALGPRALAARLAPLLGPGP